MEDKRIIFDDEQAVVEKKKSGKLLTPTELEIYLRYYLRNRDYYKRKNLHKIIDDLMDSSVWLLLVSAIVFLFGGPVLGGICGASTVIRFLYKYVTGDKKAIKQFEEEVKTMRETIESAKVIDRKKEDEMLLEPDEIPDKFIKDIHKLMDDAIESGYDNYLSDCAILHQLELRYLDVKKSLEDGSEANIIARFPMFYRVYWGMQRSIEKEIAHAKNQSVNAQASEAFLDSSGLMFSEEMLTQASLRIDELATTTVGEPELYLARTQKGLPMAQK